MMRLFGRITSISARLTLLNIFVSGIALLLAFVSFVTYDAASFGYDLTHTLHTEAQILGANVVSAMQFEDQDSATATLAALHGSPDVVSAVVLTGKGKLFAEYLRDPAVRMVVTRPLAADAADAHWTIDGKLLYGGRIMFQNHEIGTIYILAQMDEQSRRSRLYAAIAALVLVLCMGTALALTSTFRRLLTDPLVSLAETAQIVRSNKDFSVRALPARTNDELAVVVRSFNDMLDELQHRDRELEQSRTALEERVQQRTEELSATNKELEAFSYTVAHDLRGPLDMIGNIGFLLRENYGRSMDADGTTYLDELNRSIKKMSLLIEDLLKLSRSGRVAYHREPIDLSSIAAGVVADLRAVEPQRTVETSVMGSATAIADEGLLRVAVENLLRNAWKYTSKEPQAKIEFGWNTVDGEAVYFVRDNGAGFDPAYAHRLFQPFQRLHVQGDFPGTGIGLATVARIVKRHGGRIWAEGAVGSGATFYFTLPNAQPGSAE